VAATALIAAILAGGKGSFNFPEKKQKFAFNFHVPKKGDFLNNMI
jgi:hypothetical protein